MNYYATKETLQRYKLKTPEQFESEMAPFVRAVVDRERGNRLFEWDVSCFTSIEENACRSCTMKRNWSFFWWI